MTRLSGFRMAAFCAAAAILGVAAVAGADTLDVFDESGAQAKVDTAALKGCRVVFDSGGTPFEICRMERVELAPRNSTRARPGHTTATGEAEPASAAVVYRRVEN